MGTYPVHYRGGELICIGDEAEWHLPDGSTQRIRIGALDALVNRRAEGWEPPADVPVLHLLGKGDPPSHTWYGVVQAPVEQIAPSDLVLIRRSDRFFYNDGREMLPGDLVWENGFRELYIFEGVWRRGEPEHDWFFNQHPAENNAVLSFSKYPKQSSGMLLWYADAEGNRCAEMDHLTFIERTRSSL